MLLLLFHPKLSGGAPIPEEADGFASGTGDAQAVGDHINVPDVFTIAYLVHGEWTPGDSGFISEVIEDIAGGPVEAAGSSDGAGDAQAIGTSIATADGSASGTGDAQAVSDALTRGVADSSGVADAQSIGESLHAGVGSASGLGEGFAEAEVPADFTGFAVLHYAVYPEWAPEAESYALVPIESPVVLETGDGLAEGTSEALATGSAEVRADGYASGTGGAAGVSTAVRASNVIDLGARRRRDEEDLELAALAFAAYLRKAA